MDLSGYKNLISTITSGDMREFQRQFDVWQVLRNMKHEMDIESDPAIKQYVLDVSRATHKQCAKAAVDFKSKEMAEVYWRLLVFEAQLKQVDSYLLALERHREQSKRFYEPRRKHFMKFGVIQGLQDLIDDKLDLLTISMPPGTGKSTLGIYFLTGCMGWWPDMPNLASAHSGILTRSFYDGVSQIINDKFEYAWHEIFPDVEFDPKYGTNAKEQTINVGMPKRFKSLTCRAINASLTGATRSEKMLYADDLCSGIEEAMSRERMDKLWTAYNTDLKTRQKDQCKEIHIQTRWSVNDVVGRLKVLHEKDGRARFISIPALDAEGNSNFEYKYGVGFTKEYFQEMRSSMDDVSFRCLYMNEPIEREGLLYHPEEMRRYITLPREKPDAVLSIADTKNTGTDYFVQPVFAKYGDDYYLVDVICSDNSDYEAQYVRSVQLIIANHVEACRFESNAGGTRIAFEVNKRLTEANYYCNITENYSTKNKETKIIVYAPWVKQHVIFKDSSLYSTRDEYGVFMDMIFSYTMAAKAKHDDAPDVMAMFAEWQSRQGRGETIIMGSLF